MTPQFSWRRKSDLDVKGVGTNVNLFLGDPVHKMVGRLQAQIGKGC